MDKPAIPEVIERFAAYYRREPAWGALHVVLDDGRVGEHSVEFCQACANERGDYEGAALAAILLRMSPTQRRKLPNVVYRMEHERRDEQTRAERTRVTDKDMAEALARGAQKRREAQT